MIIGNEGRPLLKSYEKAREDEANATKNLLAAMESGLASQDELLELTKQMEEAHDTAMGIWQELQAFRLDQ